jgi:hypothetical protein
MRIPGQGGRDSEIDPVRIPKLIRSPFRDEVGQGFRFLFGHFPPLAGTPTGLISE